MTRSQTTVAAPRTSDRLLWDMIFGMYAYPVLLLGHKLKLFTMLAEEPRTAGEVAAALKLQKRPADAILAVSTAVGLLELRDGRYSLAPVAQEYLVEGKPTYFGAYLDLTIANASVFSLASLEQALFTDAQQVYGGGREMFTVHDEQAELARVFTRSMHASSMAPALAWPELLDLAGHEVMLDVGGGSGAHSIGACLRWPQLRAAILDTQPVTEVARQFIASYQLGDRIDTVVADMWSDPFPRADLHFYGMIHHDWPPQKAAALTAKSFQSLERGGRIVIHDMLYKDDKTGPFAAAAFSLVMVLWTEGQQYSAKEYSAMLGEAGFVDIEVKPSFGHWSIVTGRKP